MAYRDSTQPGRYVRLRSYLARSITLLYLVPLAVAGALTLLLVILPGSESAPQLPLCFLSMEPAALYYSTAALAFLLPDLFTTLFNLHYLLAYLRSSFADFNRFLLFPIVQMLGSGYYLVVTTWRVIAQDPTAPFAYSELPMYCVPILFVLVFWLIVIAKLSGW